MSAETVSTNEETIRAIFRDVMSADSMDAEANFFQLGGSSMQMIAIIGQIESLEGANLDASVAMQTFFEAQTMKELISQLASIARPARHPTNDH